MKAINIDGTIKIYSNLKSFGGALGLQYSSDSDLEALGFYDVVTPTTKQSQELGSIEWDADNEVFTYPIKNRTYSQTVAELKTSKIENLKYNYGRELGKTDWYIIRGQEGTAAPQNIIDARAALRSECASKEAEINALSTKASIIDYELPSFR
tara:strand:- start:1113 stop:1571 length:459 start_codon:yes stop_codon:yes gene_type:complete